jgi:pyruvate dehydrogenase E2 component (dihydrolipoamide acetyltransferase)
MPTNVMMPQMGESIAEGTIVRWIKKIGDPVDRDEPLFEISTDKVDAEIPSPAAGVLTDIKVKEGETVPVNSVVAVIGAAGETVATPPVRDGIARSDESRSTAAAASGADVAPASALPEAAVGQPERTAGVPVPAATKSGTGSPRPGTAEPHAQAGIQQQDEQRSKDDLRRQKSSPLVRRIAKEHDVDIRQIHGTGINGRVTKHDILGYLHTAGSRSGGTGEGAAGATSGYAEGVPGGRFQTQAPAYGPGENVRVVPMSIMRKKIAEHMVLSARTSPHVYSVYEVNFGRVSALREKHKARFEAAGAKLTYTAFVAKVIVDALRQFPVANASVDGDNIVYKKDINLGIAVALDNGLIVPVIRNADEKNLLGLARAINDLGARARAKKLNPDEVQGGTFTITNPGIFGALYGLPLINQPQVAILGVGAVEKRPLVIDDAIGIRPTCHLTLGYDHRLIDGADAGRFLSFVKERLENFDEAWM